MGSYSALAQSDFDERNCPSIDFLSKIDASYQETNIVGYDMQQNVLLGSLTHSVLIAGEGEEKEGAWENTGQGGHYIFTIAGFPVANGENIDDAANPLIAQLQSDNNVPFTYSIAANRKNTNDQLNEDGLFYICSYSLANNKHVSAIFSFNLKPSYIR